MGLQKSKRTRKPMMPRRDGTLPVDNGRLRAERTKVERMAQRQAFKDAGRGPCAMCAFARVEPEIRQRFGAALIKLEAHHVLEKSDLRDCGLPTDALWDPRLALPVCSYHHQRHHAHRERIPRALVPPSVYEFAEEHHVSWLLDREYPA